MASPVLAGRMEALPGALVRMPGRATPFGLFSGVVPKA